MENAKAEILERKLDKLNHFLAAFESGRVVDAKYYSRFASVAESVDELINVGMFIDVPNEYKNAMRQCVKAAQEQDSKSICEILTPFCDVLQAKLEEGDTKDTLEKVLIENLLELKNALLKDDTPAADIALKKIANIKLDPCNRELYFNLYDLLMEDKTDEAVKRIDKWLKF